MTGRPHTFSLVGPARPTGPSDAPPPGERRAEPARIAHPGRDRLPPELPPMNAIPPERLAAWDAPRPVRRRRLVRWVALLGGFAVLGAGIWLVLALLDTPSPTSVGARLERETVTLLPERGPDDALVTATAQLQTSRDELVAEVARLRQELARLDLDLAARRAELTALAATAPPDTPAPPASTAPPFPFPAPRPEPPPR